MMSMQGMHKIPITILVCDDDEGDRMLTQLAFEDAHISNELRFVTDGAQMMDYLYQRGDFGGGTGAAPRPGLILLDVDMDHVAGDAARRAIKSDGALRDIPVIMLSKPVAFSGLVETMNLFGQYWIEIVELPPAPTG
jgi:CheY-like chemotaxis protein